MTSDDELLALAEKAITWRKNNPFSSRTSEEESALWGASGPDRIKQLIQEKRESEVRYDEVIEAYDDRCRALEKAEARLAEAEGILTRLVQNTMVGKEETWKARVQVIEDEADALLTGGEQQ